MDSCLHKVKLEGIYKILLILLIIYLLMDEIKDN